MKLILFVLTFFGAYITVVNNVNTKNIDVAKSSIIWKGKKFTGEHTGNVTIKSGVLNVKENKLTGGSFVIDMGSMVNTDIKDANYKAKLENQLKSADFFGVEKYPTAVFKIVNARVIQGNKYQINGNLTIKNISDNISFPAYVNVKNGKLTAKADIVVDRTKFDIKFKSDSFFDSLGDWAIYDYFSLSIFLASE